MGLKPIFSEWAKNRKSDDRISDEQSGVLAVMCEIRKRFNNTVFKDEIAEYEERFNKAVSALDLIEDTEIAIISYENLQEFLPLDNGYLSVYGLFQALFLQQDALSLFHEIVNGSKLRFDKDYPRIHEIREIRNKAVGHPVLFQRNEVTYTYRIHRSAMAHGGFRLEQTEHANGREISVSFIEVDVHSIINDQRGIVTKVCCEIVHKLDAEIEGLKAKG